MRRLAYVDQDTAAIQYRVCGEEAKLLEAVLIECSDSGAGVMESNEGPRIINYLATELGLSESKRDQMLADFVTRCSEWMREAQC